MNSREEILGRLLRSFPVRYLVKAFDTKGWKQEDVIEELLETNNEANILAFVSENFDITKQSVFIYAISNNYQHKKLIKNADLECVILDQNLNNGIFTLKGFHQIKYDVKLFEDTLIETDLKFIQPFKLTIMEGYIIIAITKMEANIKTFYPTGTLVLNHSKEDIESNLINRILTFFDVNHNVRPQQADLNKGIKELWEADVIDGKELSFREASSRTKVVMDGEKLYKEKYPKRYANMMRKPLELCIFRYLGDDEDYPSHFRCEPANGRISFSLYSTNINQINNVLNGIIGNN